MGLGGEWCPRTAGFPSTVKIAGVELETCYICGGEGVIDSWADSGPVRCSACHGTGSRSPLAAQLLSLQEVVKGLPEPELDVLRQAARILRNHKADEVTAG